MSSLDVDAVVIGAGAFGASTAFHLALRGRAVALVDRHAVVSQTSPRAAGLAVQVRENPAFAWLARRSVEKIVAFEETTGVPLAYSQAGSLAIARTLEHAGYVRRHIELGRRTGLEVELVRPAAASELAPFIDASSALAISHTPSDLHLDEPGDLPLAYIEAAGRLGAEVLPHTAVEAVELGARPLRVVTDRGDITAGAVVDTAGAWAAAVAELVGTSLPIVAARHQLFITAPIPGIRREHPSVRVADANVYTRPARGGLMLGGYEPEPLALDEVDETVDVAELALDPAPLQRLAASVEDVFPLLAAASVAELRGGLPTLTADGLFILDRLPGVDGFYVVAGCNVGGLSTSPAVGEAMAGWIVDGQAAIDLSPFRLARFDTWSSARALRDAALLHYSRTEFA